MKHEKNESAVALGRLGGIARSSKYPKEKLIEWATKASMAAKAKREAKKAEK